MEQRRRVESKFFVHTTVHSEVRHQAFFFVNGLQKVLFIKAVEQKIVELHEREALDVRKHGGWETIWMKEPDT